jgi:hypothetical protein
VILDESWDDYELNSDYSSRLLSFIKTKKATEASVWLTNLKEKCRNANNNGFYQIYHYDGLFDASFWSPVGTASNNISFFNSRNQMIYDRMGDLAENPKPTASSFEYELEYNYPIILDNRITNYFGVDASSTSSTINAATKAITIQPELINSRATEPSRPSNIAKITVQYLGMEETINNQNQLMSQSLANMLNPKSKTPESKTQKIEINNSGNKRN